MDSFTYIDKLLLRETATPRNCNWIKMAAGCEHDQKNVALYTRRPGQEQLIEIPFGIPCEIYWKSRMKTWGSLKGSGHPLCFGVQDGSPPEVSHTSSARRRKRAGQIPAQRMLLGRLSLANGKPGQHRSHILRIAAKFEDSLLQVETCEFNLSNR
jgi:hypothetical protein